MQMYWMLDILVAGYLDLIIFSSQVIFNYSSLEWGLLVQTLK